jgi:disulfide bond formation protein DsbB
MVYRTQKLSAVLILVLVALTLGACGGKSEEPEPVVADQAQAAAPAAVEAPAGDAAKGKELFATSCVACHGPAGEGVAGLGKDMTTSEFIAGLSDTELVEFIKRGRDPGDPLNTTGVLMPPKGGNPALSDAQLMDIVAFMRTIHK